MIGNNISILTISFGNLTAGLESTQESIVLANIGSVQADVLMNGTDWDTGSETMDVGRTHFSNSSMSAWVDGVAMYAIETDTGDDLANGASQTYYFILSIPFGQAAGEYNQSITMTLDC